MTSDSGFKRIRHTPNILQLTVFACHQIDNIFRIIVDIFLDVIGTWDLMTRGTKVFGNMSMLTNLADIMSAFVETPSTTTIGLCFVDLKKRLGET